MKLTTKGRYGVRAMANLAGHGNGAPLSIAKIAKEEELSPEFLEQIFFRLRKAGLIRSTRGPKGGFVLNREPAEISIRAILDAVGEPLHPTPCTEHGKVACERESYCTMSPVWHEFYDKIRSHLDSVSLAQIIEGKRSVATRGAPELQTSAN